MGLINLIKIHGKIHLRRKYIAPDCLLIITPGARVNPYNGEHSEDKNSVDNS